MLTPQEFTQLIDGLEDLARQFDAAGGGPLHAAYVQDLRRTAAELRDFSRQPLPAYAQDGFMESVRQRIDAMQAALKNVPIRNVPAATAFTPWDGAAIAQEMLLGLRLLQPAQKTRPSKAVSENAWEDWDNWDNA